MTARWRWPKPSPPSGPRGDGGHARLIARRVSSRAWAYPRHRGALIVANHPTGIADGLVLWRLLMRRRPTPSSSPMPMCCACCRNWARSSRPSNGAPTARPAPARVRPWPMPATRSAGTGGSASSSPPAVLPSGVGLRLHERPWMSSAAALARKFDLPVIPSTSAPATPRSTTCSTRSTPPCATSRSSTRRSTRRRSPTWSPSARRSRPPTCRATRGRPPPSCAPRHSPSASPG
jgi:hypothetical protein